MRGQRNRALSENLEKRAFYAAFSKAAISAPPDRPNNRFSPEWPINRGLAVEMALRGRNDGTSATTVLPALGAWKPAKDAGFHILVQNHKIPISKVVEAVKGSNNDIGARLVEFSGREYMVRGRGYIKSLNKIQQTVVGTNPATGTPILVRDLGTTTLGPDMRRGVAELNGQGEVVGGVVIMRYGENAEKVIERVKAKLAEMKATLPP